MIDKIVDKDLPGLYQCGNEASQVGQDQYFSGTAWYLIVLLAGTVFSFWGVDPYPVFKITSAVLFLISLSLMIWLKVTRPEDIWYNGRAVAESVKTRAWRFMMKAIPYESVNDEEIVNQKFISDLRDILKQNESFISKFSIKESVEEPISITMRGVRALVLNERVTFYKKERITDQANWYATKSAYNKKKANQLFIFTVVFHGLAIIGLLYMIYAPSTKIPVAVFAFGASAIFTWLQTKKHNELSSSYTLTAHEITLIKAETNLIQTEEQFSEYVINCENAFSREHTQWIARKKR